MNLVLELFGGFRLSHQNAEPVVLTERARALLAYLAVAQSPFPRQVLAQLLSDNGSEQEQRTHLRQTLYLLRKATVENIVLSHSSGDIYLNTGLVEADAHLFKRAVTGSDRSSLEGAVALYRGPFLDGVKAPSAAFEEWLQARRAEFLERVIEALLKLSGLDAANGAHANALADARRILSLDPLREDAHRCVMRSLAALGQRASALRHYETARQLLAEELGVEPEEETLELYQFIARGNGRTQEMSGPAPGPARVPAFLANWFGVRRAMVAVAVVVTFMTGGVAAWYARQPPVSANLPSIAVLPFKNEKGGESTILDVLTTMLSAHPGFRVVSINLAPSFAANARQQYRSLGARYVLEGTVQKTPGKVHAMVRLIEAETGNHLWASRFEEKGNDTSALDEQIAYGVYESLAGFTGEIERHEQRLAWSKPFLSLNDYDYDRRGHQFLFQFTREAHAKAQQIFEEGLRRFSDSTVLRISLAALHRHAVEVGWSNDPGGDLETAWRLGQEASLAVQRTRNEMWVSHWIIAKLAQWCKNDFERSVAEARSAIRLNPYEATARADIAELMANAGKTGEAIEWLQESIRRDPKGPEWYGGNLAWAYYLAGRYEDALIELQQLNKPRLLLLAAVYVRLGRSGEAHTAMADFLKRNPGYVLADAARWPLLPALKPGWLADLRQAGLAENFAKRN
jgi:DNA-binding SARP family transcriptional activator/TolB-like protein